MSSDRSETSGEIIAAAEPGLGTCTDGSLGVPGGGHSFVRTHWRPLTLLVLSATLTVLFVIARPHILFDDGDPLTYFRKAWWFIGQPGGMDVPSRGPGYPIWLILTGAASLQIWWILAASQVAMALVAPVLVYGILAPISRNAAFAGGLLFALFGIAFVNMNWVMTEQLFLFMELVSLLLISRHLSGVWEPLARPARSQWSAHLRYWPARFSRSPYAIVVALAYTTMVKPAAGPFFWLFLAVCLLFRVEPWKRYLGPAVLYVAIMTGWGSYDYLYSPVRFSPLGMPTTPAQRNFADVYYGRGFAAVNGWTPAPRQRDADPQQPKPADAVEPSRQSPTMPDRLPAPPTVTADSGPASQRLYQAVATLVESLRGSGQWNVADAESVYQLYGRYNARELVDVVFLRPNPLYYQLVVSAAASAGGDTLLQDVAREHGNAGIKAYLNYLANNPTVPVLGSPNPYVGFMFFMKFHRYRDYIATKQIGMRDLFLSGYREELVTEANGPATRVYAQSVRLFVDAMPQFVFQPGNEFLKDFGTLDAFKAYAIENPYHPKYSGGMMGNIYQWMLLLYGEQTTGRLLGTAGLESMFKNAPSLGMVVGDYLAAMAYSGGGYHVGVPDLLTDFSARFAGVRSLEAQLLTAAVDSGKQTQLPPSLGRHVGVSREQGNFSKTVAALQIVGYGVFKWIKPFLFVGMIVFAIPLMMTSVGGRLVALLVPAYFVSAAAFTVVMIMPKSDPRHEEVYAFFALLVTVAGLAMVPQFLQRIFSSNEPSGPERTLADECEMVVQQQERAAGR